MRILLTVAAAGVLASCSAKGPVAGDPGDEAAALRDPDVPADQREQAARALAEEWNVRGNEDALEAYIKAVEGADSDSHRRELLAHAHRFRDREGRVLGLLDTSIREMRLISPEMVSALGAMTDVEAIETMMKVVGRSTEKPAVPERDIALRYIGRAARSGRREAVAFLSMCAQSANEDLKEKASAEMRVLAGRDAPKGWRDWWFANISGERKAWLEESFATVGGRAFESHDREHVSELVARIPADGDAEPEMWFLEQALGRKFGYVSPRDVFDPDVDPQELAISNRRAVATARDWWRENAPYLFFNPATGRFDISEEARRIGVPVDPKTGKPGGK